jgi:hypothetical protein
MKVGLLLALIPGLALAQAYRAPRTAYGQPSFEGIWQASATATAYNIEPHTPSLGIPGGIGVISDPADGKIPYKPEARAKQQENFANRAQRDPMNQCYSPGVPRTMYLAFPFQILQREDYVVFQSEYAHTVRNIFLKGEHLDGLELWMGDSRVKWEGETLVVDTNNYNNETWFDAAGNHHSAQLHTVERFTRTGENTLSYQVTIEDPATFTRPWTMQLLFYRHQEPNFRVLEYECHAYMELEGSK